MSATARSLASKNRAMLLLVLEEEPLLAVCVLLVLSTMHSFTCVASARVATIRMGCKCVSVGTR